jgi:hypothetical protein
MYDLKNNTSIIVCHYNSLDFLEFVDPFTNYQLNIYDKSNNCNITENSFTKVISCPNIGREGFVYLNYIINNYKILQEYTLFIQDDTQQHIPDINAFYKQTVDVITNNKNFLIYPVWWRNTGEWCQQVHIRYFNNGFSNCGFPNITKLVQELTDKMNLTLQNGYFTETCSFFIVKKQNILKYSLEQYITLKNMIIENVEYEYGLELLWKAFFM